MAQNGMSLAQAMKERGLTDETLAQKCGVSRAFITHIRNRSRYPSLSVAVKLERHTGVPAVDFAKSEA